MNILFLKLYITNDIGNGFYNSQEIGLAKAVTELYPEHHVDIVLLSCGVSGEERTEVTDKITLHVMPPVKGIGHHGMIDLGLIKDLKADLVHLLADNMMFAPNVIRYCRANGIKCHLYIGTMFSDSNKWYKKAISKALMRRNIREYRKTVVYVKTPAVQKQCKELGIEANLAPVGIGAEETVLSTKSVEEIREKYGLPMDKKLLLFVGRLEAYKHPLEAVDLLAKLRDASESGKDCHLVVVGRGELEGALLTRAEELGVRDRLAHLEKVPNSEMKDLYKACEYFVNFNPDEIYGMSILEAMCQRCLVLAISAPGPEFLIDDGKTGFVCQNVDEMAKRIASFEDAGHKGDVEVMLENARKKVLEELVWTSTAKAFIDFAG